MVPDVFLYGRLPATCRPSRMGLVCGQVVHRLVRTPVADAHLPWPHGLTAGTTLFMSVRTGFRSDRNERSGRSEQRIACHRVPPHSVEAAQAVLGGLMLAPEAFDRVNEALTEKDFYRRDHQLIYRAIRELSERDRPFDAVTLGEWFESQG